MFWGRQNKSASFFMSLQQVSTCRESQTWEQSSKKIISLKKDGGGKNTCMLEYKVFLVWYAEVMHSRNMLRNFLSFIYSILSTSALVWGKHRESSIISHPFPVPFRYQEHHRKPSRQSICWDYHFSGLLYGDHICEYLYPLLPPSPSTAQIQLPRTIWTLTVVYVNSLSF